MKRLFCPLSVRMTRCCNIGLEVASPAGASYVHDEIAIL